MEKTEHVQSVAVDSWHYRVYRWWERNTPRSRHRRGNNRRENRCHYLSIVLFQAPWLWLFRGSVGGFRPPIGILFIITYIAAVSGTLAYRPEIGFPWLVITGVVILALGLLFATIFLCFMYPRQMTNLAMVVFSPVWLPLFGIWLVVTYIHDHGWHRRIIDPVSRFWSRIWPYVLKVLGVLALAGLGWGMWLIGCSGLLIVAESLGIALLLLVVATVLAMLGLAGWDHYWDRRFGRTAPTKTETFFRLFASHVADAKNGLVICPYIVLPGQDESRR